MLSFRTCLLVLHSSHRLAEWRVLIFLQGLRIGAATALEVQEWNSLVW